MSFTHAESYPLRSIDPLLSLVAVKHGHTISAVGVEPCTGGSTFQGGGSVLKNQFQGGGGGGSVLKNQFEGGGWGGGLN